MNKILAIFLVLAIFLIGLGVWQSFKKSPTVKINNHEFQLQIAKTAKEKEIGLSKYENLPKDLGMLFPFEKPDYYSFWMKNMKIAIDIIYINKDHVVTVFPNLQPPKSPDENLSIFKPDEPADKVLEINAGLSEKYGIKKEDVVIFENLQ